ncbi:CDP-diacylglycerol--glycerol-3-phosphate 3-phosphatidyltransferase [Spiroplasma endosymbiont of Anurida maritima]|uniref:CDP-diacylglycerol--glycerol-3-phosphate 3-phosphatidyltransferase n=1 Tax=Spiroplasma endosymbiont of Anurida maritima TaxID=2967972 RepID=UPI0036D35F41
MNLANKITMIRMILIPFIIVLMIIFPFGLLFNVWDTTIGTEHYQLPISYLIGGVLFVLASITDAIDGYVARSRKQITTFGKFFDAIADKLLTNSVLIIFTVANMVPIWLTLIFVLRDFLIDAVRQVLATKKVVMAANKAGKYRAATEMLGLTILFFVGNGIIVNIDINGSMGMYGFINQIVLIPLYISAFLSVYSAYNYMKINRKALFVFEKEE